MESVGGVVVAAVEPFQVHHAETARFSHQPRKGGVDDGVHGGGEDGYGEAVGSDGKLGDGELGVGGDVAGYDGDFLESVGPAEFPYADCW